jgi:hypothetical protein
MRWVHRASATGSIPADPPTKAGHGFSPRQADTPTALWVHGVADSCAGSGPLLSCGGENQNNNEAAMATVF